jgi:hypothetical protein
VKVRHYPYPTTLWIPNSVPGQGTHLNHIVSLHFLFHITASLAVHERSHAKPFTCTECPKAYATKRKDNYNYQLRIIRKLPAKLHNYYLDILETKNTNLTVESSSIQGNTGISSGGF